MSFTGYERSSLPSRFQSSLTIDGILATDLLQPQILMGMELKGWYVLAKEKEPSFRYRVTPAVCAPADLLVVVPWALSNVISGAPLVFAPFVIGAKYAAEYRNWHWKFQRTSATDQAITLSSVSQHYPTKSDMISDRPANDGGGNFGRLARAGVMDAYIQQHSERLSGIPVAAWQKFLSIFTESSSSEEIENALVRLADPLARGGDTTRLNLLREKLAELAALIK